MYFGVLLAWSTLIHQQEKTHPTSKGTKHEQACHMGRCHLLVHKARRQSLSLPQTIQNFSF